MSADPAIATCRHPAEVRIGPEIPESGSWNWLGQDLIDEWGTSKPFQIKPFSGEFPSCDVLVFIKWLPSLKELAELSSGAAIVYCPVDIYGSSREIDADWRRLTLCDRVILHTPFLEKYFRSYTSVVCLDHHLKFSVPARQSYVAEGPILWTGGRADLPPLVDWVNQHGLPEELIVLTDFEGHAHRTSGDFGFASDRRVVVEEWSAERHLKLLAVARAAIDVNGQDFRQRHKPAAKALDVISSGVPLAMSAGSSSARYLRGLGFEVVTPEDRDRWLSEDYWQETQHFSRYLSDSLSRTSIADRWEDVINDVLIERDTA